MVQSAPPPLPFLSDLKTTAALFPLIGNLSGPFFPQNLGNGKQLNVSTHGTTPTPTETHTHCCVTCQTFSFRSREYRPFSLCSLFSGERHRRLDRTSPGRGRKSSSAVHIERSEYVNSYKKTKCTMLGSELHKLWI